MLEWPHKATPSYAILAVATHYMQYIRGIMQKMSSIYNLRLPDYTTNILDIELKNVGHIDQASIW